MLAAQSCVGKKFILLGTGIFFPFSRAYPLDVYSLSEAASIISGPPGSYGFGASFLLSDPFLFVSDPSDGNGALFVYKSMDGKFSEIQKITKRDEYVTSFGDPFAISKDRIWIGSYFGIRNNLIRSVGDRISFWNLRLRFK